MTDKYSEMRAEGVKVDKRRSKYEEAIASAFYAPPAADKKEGRPFYTFSMSEGNLHVQLVSREQQISAVVEEFKLFLVACTFDPELVSHIQVAEGL